MKHPHNTGVAGERLTRRSFLEQAAITATGLAAAGTVAQAGQLPPKRPPAEVPATAQAIADPAKAKDLPNRGRPIKSSAAISTFVFWNSRRSTCAFLRPGLGLRQSRGILQLAPRFRR